MNVADIAAWDGPAWSEVLAAAAGDTSAPARAGDLWQIYAPLLNPVGTKPFVVGQVGQSLDGRVATANGHSHYINGPTALTHLHRLRALVDAVVVGVGTAIADNPQLTVRHTGGVHPARVVIDPSGRLPLDSKCMDEDGVRRVIIRSCDAPLPPGVEGLTLPRRNGALDPADILAGLQGLGFRRILIEGGPNTLGHFVAGGHIDRLHIMIAPMIIGSGPTGLQLPPISHLNASLRPRMSVFRLSGGDLLCDCDLAGAQ